MERVDLNDRDALAAEADADGCLTHWQTSQLIRAEQVGLANAEEATDDGPGGAELDLADELCSAAGA